MRTPRPVALRTGPSGLWRVWVHPLRQGLPKVEVTRFRGAPTQVTALSTTDPFGPAAASLTFPGVTVMEPIGAGDLDWCQEEADVDICWCAEDGTVLYTWEGYFASFTWSSDAVGSSLSVECAGGMHQQDNYLAKPEHLYYPLPYEWAIWRQFNNHPDSRLAQMDAPGGKTFPSWWGSQGAWATYHRKNYPSAQPWLVPDPATVKDGDLWTGMLTHDTGHFDASLTGYIQGLLSNMYTARGQFTLDLATGRKPFLTHRDHLHVPDANTLVVDLLWPGVRINPSRDFTQRVGVVYGSGKSANGDTWSGMEFTADGSSAFYHPLAFRPQVHPVAKSNPWLDKAVMRKEVKIDFADGLTQEEATTAAADRLIRFSDPGITATLTLATDPLTQDGQLFARQRIQAGGSINVIGLFGQIQGVLFHITNASQDAQGLVSLTLDSLYRDFLTVDQVRKRGTDALTVYRTLSTKGLYDPRIPDLLFPWSYKKGSGVIPTTAAPLFSNYGPEWSRRAGVENYLSVPFPWTEYTTRFPPSKCPSFYVKVPPADWNANSATGGADNNWANLSRTRGKFNKDGFAAYKVLLAASGDISLVQIAAYNADGTVKKVPFHVSLYYNSGVSFSSMPQIPVAGWKTVTKTAKVTGVAGNKTFTLSGLPVGHGLGVADLVQIVEVGKTNWFSNETTHVKTWGPTSITVQTTVAPTASGTHKVTVSKALTGTLKHPYDPGQHYPFFEGAWEKITSTGQTPTTPTDVPTATSAMLAGWGTYYEMAGYWPGSQQTTGDNATGMLVDESGFQFDFRSNDGSVGSVDVRKSPAENQKTPLRVTAYVMIYCDADHAKDTYFLGRMFRQDYSNA